MISALFARAAPWLVAGLLAVIGVQWVGLNRAETRMAQAREAWADERTDAADRALQQLEYEIAAHNRTSNELEVNHAQAETLRASVAANTASAAVAADAVQRSAGRLRDALETHRLGIAAALEAAGAAGQCQAATEAADLLRGMLGRYRAEAAGLAGAGRAIGADADAQHAAASECAGWGDAVIRGSAAP